MTSELDNENVIQPLGAEGTLLGSSQKTGVIPAESSREAIADPSPQPSIRRTGGAGESVLVESHYRSIVKAISWRATGTVDTMVVSFLITGRLKLALSIGFVELFTKIGLYYFHERLWGKIGFGRVKATEDYQI